MGTKHWRDPSVSVFQGMFACVQVCAHERERDEREMRGEYAQPQTKSSFLSLSKLNFLLNKNVLSLVCERTPRDSIKQDLSSHFHVLKEHELTVIYTTHSTNTHL